ncbi:MAG: hypothetical protein COA79_10605 [Planctomycetota bacterium]|nr:MAG: hypothetical protein COA79_10605 [Planctomycetota bacterium]
MTDSHSQDELAKEISAILTDKNLKSNERVKKMKELLKNNSSKKTQAPVSQEATYSNSDIKKAALRNQMLNKKNI